jgi:hypothetical protein
MDAQIYILSSRKQEHLTIINYPERRWFFDIKQDHMLASLKKTAGWCPGRLCIGFRLHYPALWFHKHQAHIRQISGEDQEEKSGGNSGVEDQTKNPVDKL